MNNEKEMSAVDWVFNEIYVAKGNLSFIEIRNIKEQAKEMEKRQIKNAFINGYLNLYNAQNNINADEIFYEKTYGGNK